MLTETMKTGIQRIIMNSNRVIICAFTSWVPYFDIRYGFRIKTMFGSTLPPVVCQGEGGQLYLHAYIGIQHILCCVLMFCFSSSCAPNVASFSGLSFFSLSLRYSLTCLFVMCLVYHMLPVSLNCPFFIAPSVFSNVYQTHVFTQAYFTIVYNCLLIQHSICNGNDLQRCKNRNENDGD